ncbi:MAG: tRNA (adenosine(37)-N6)-threonylcarbamoyltransferase complex dimerization subunit type 1 TsaB [Halochromatium sp.]
MKILALETSGACCSAALLIADRLEQRHEHAPRRHADLILGMLDDLLREAGLRLSDLDALAYGRGPGSFTGVRIAAAVAQGVAFGAQRPVIAVSTLAATARAAYRQTGRRRIACALDARMGEVYWGCFEVAGPSALMPIDQEGVFAPASTPVLTGTGWCGAGHGWAAYPALRERHRSALEPTAEPVTESPPLGSTPEPGWAPGSLSGSLSGSLPGSIPGPASEGLLTEIGPEAGDIAWLAHAMSEQAQRPDRALPVYLRNRVAAASRKS